jgi:hypothetical protein
MRWIIAVAMVLLAFCATSAFAASAYDDVPRDHWAYNALDYLTERGVLEGYPDGFFKGDRTLTRYEFAQAVARLLDTIGNGDWEDQINVMAESLRAEFSDQLAELNKKIDGLSGQVSDLDSQVSDLDGKVTDQGSKLSALDEKIKSMKPGPNWKGEFRYRWQFENRGDKERFRQRISFILGYSKQVNDAVTVDFRLKTNTGKDGTSGNFTLGNDGKTADIWLDRAYVKYTPSWFGAYFDADCKEIPKLDIYAGIMPNITYDPHEMILDSDINLQGLGLVYHFNKDFQILTAASVVVEYNGADYFDDDTYFFATELKHNNFLTCGLDAWLGCYGWKNENRLPAGTPNSVGGTVVGYKDNVFADNGLAGFDFNNDGTVDGNDRFSPNFNTIKGGLQYTFQCLFDKPLAVFGEYMVNVDSTADDRIAAVNPYIDPNIIYENTDDIGYVFGAQYGTKPEAKGEWYAYGRYKEIGANAIIDGYGDSDAGGANVNSLEVGWTYMWADNCLLGITYFMNKMNNAFGFLIPSSKDDQNIVQVDWTFKF